MKFIKKFNVICRQDYEYRKSLFDKVTDFGAEQLYRQSECYAYECISGEIIRYRDMLNKKFGKKSTYVELKQLDDVIELLYK